MTQLAPSAMAGFDAEFTDLENYIRVITHRIWEERRIDDIHRYYSDPCIVETPAGVSSSVADVIAGTRATLVQFPDRRLLAEDVIGSGNATGGFLSSHRIISHMTHLGSGNFGEASGRRIHVRTIADCVCKDNRIVHEWLVRDQGAIAEQIGISLKDLAFGWLEKQGGWIKPLAPPAPHDYRSHISAHPDATSYAQEIRGFASHRPGVASMYDEAVHHIGPCNRSRHGIDEVQDFWRALFNVFEVSTFAIEHLAMEQGDGRADRLTFRWRANAIHTDGGLFGPATGKPVEIMGINHVELWRGKIIREWALIDEVALWMQVLA